LQQYYLHHKSSANLYPYTIGQQPLAFIYQCENFTELLSANFSR